MSRSLVPAAPAGALLGPMAGTPTGPRNLKLRNGLPLPPHTRDRPGPCAMHSVIHARRRRGFRFLGGLLGGEIFLGADPEALDLVDEGRTLHAAEAPSRLGLVPAVCAQGAHDLLPLRVVLHEALA